MNHQQLIANALNISLNYVTSTLNLLENGATVPFIARYRKEVTGSLDEVQIADIQQYKTKLVDLDKRRESIIKSIEEQGKMTDELQNKILKSTTVTELEDIYLPFKKKRKTRASVAKEKGLEPLALRLLAQNRFDVAVEAKKYLNDAVNTADDALSGARDIIAEIISEDETARNTMRFIFSKSAILTSKVARGKEEEGIKYKDYFKCDEMLSKCPSHRLLAIRRGEEEGFLRVSIAPSAESSVYELEKIFVFENNEAARQVKIAVTDSYERLLQPSIETEFRNTSKEKADVEAIRVFTENLSQLLLAAPLGEKCILGIDPGFRTGCKTVVLDKNGNLLHYSTIFPHPPQQDEFGASNEIRHLCDQYFVEAIAVGNGTAGRETMAILNKIKFDSKIDFYMVNENGASIYSASAVAREEFPDHDITVRGAVSIARRLMDPLAELVKIDAKSIGVGQYQHDVNQSLLKESLDRVVESCVNSVGINLNTASRHLLTYVSGLGPNLAQKIVDYRVLNGAFKSRNELKKIPRMGEKAFEQCAGFLRIRDAINPLDNTAVHPEIYSVVEKMATDLDSDVSNLILKKELRQQIDLKNYVTKTIGLPTLNDIIKELNKPGLDPRGKAKSFEFGNVHKIEDLSIGMVLPGIVTNITNFGAFVDIGIKQDGMVHISQLANKFVKNPADVVVLQQQVMVKVTDVDFERKRVFLSMKEV